MSDPTHVVDQPSPQSALAFCQHSLKVKTPPHPNFTFFEHFGKTDGLFIDVGAHAGQSIAYLSAVLPEASFVAFEPNPMFRECAAYMRQSLVDRLIWHEAAVGDKEGEITLYVPEVTGDIAFKPTLATGLGPSVRASALRRQLEKPAVIETLRRNRTNFDLRIAEVSTKAMVLDTLKLRPSFMKIDVEGFELNVVRGSAEMLDYNDPVLMIEKNEHEPVIEFLAEKGYRPYSYNSEDRSITPFEAQPRVNDIFFLREDNLGRIKTGSTGLRWISG